MAKPAAENPQLPIDPSVSADPDKNAYAATHALSRAAQAGIPNNPTPAQAAPSVLGISKMAEAAPAGPPRPYVEERYEVQENAEIPCGASKFAISKGQIVTSAGFDIEQIKRGGGHLKKLQDRRIEA